MDNDPFPVTGAWREDDEPGARNHWHRTGINTDGAGVRVMAHAISKLRRGLVDPTDVEVQIGSIAIAAPRREQDRSTSGNTMATPGTAGAVSPWVQAGFSDISGPKAPGAVDAGETRLN